MALTPRQRNRLLWAYRGAGLPDDLGTSIGLQTAADPQWAKRGSAVKKQENQRATLLAGALKSGSLKPNQLTQQDMALVGPRLKDNDNDFKGGIFSDMADVVGNLGSDILDTLKGIPGGIKSGAEAFGNSFLNAIPMAYNARSKEQQESGLVRDFWKPIGDQYAYTYAGKGAPEGSSLLGRIAEHPLGPLLDVATVASLGAGGTIRAGTAVSRSGGALSSTKPVQLLARAGSTEGRAPVTLNPGQQARANVVWPTVERRYSSRPLRKAGQVAWDVGARNIRPWGDFDTNRTVRRLQRQSHATGLSASSAAVRAAIRPLVGSRRDLTVEETTALDYALRGWNTPAKIQASRQMFQDAVDGKLPEGHNLSDFEGVFKTPQDAWSFVLYKANLPKSVENLILNPTDRMINAAQVTREAAEEGFSKMDLKFEEMERRVNESQQVLSDYMMGRLGKKDDDEPPTEPDIFDPDEPPPPRPPTGPNWSVELSMEAQQLFGKRWDDLTPEQQSVIYDARPDLRPPVERTDLGEDAGEAEYKDFQQRFNEFVDREFDREDLSEDQLDELWSRWFAGEFDNPPEDAGISPPPPDQDALLDALDDYARDMGFEDFMDLNMRGQQPLEPPPRGGENQRGLSDEAKDKAIDDLAYMLQAMHGEVDDIFNDFERASEVSERIIERLHPEGVDSDGIGIAFDETVGPGYSGWEEYIRSLNNIYESLIEGGSTNMRPPGGDILDDIPSLPWAPNTVEELQQMWEGQPGPPQNVDELQKIWDADDQVDDVGNIFESPEEPTPPSFVDPDSRFDELDEPPEPPSPLPPQAFEFGSPDDYPINPTYVPNLPAIGFQQQRPGWLNRTFSDAPDEIFTRGKRDRQLSTTGMTAQNLFAEPTPNYMRERPEILASGAARIDAKAFVEAVAKREKDLVGQAFSREIIGNLAAKDATGELLRFNNQEEVLQKLGQDWVLVNDEFPLRWFHAETNVLEDTVRRMEELRSQGYDIDAPEVENVLNEIADVHAKQFIKGAFSAAKLDGVAIPRQFFNYQRRLVTASDPFDNKFGRVYSRFMHRWRALTLAYMPRWALNTAIGSFALNMVKGVTPRDYMTARRLYKEGVFGEPRLGGVELGNITGMEYLEPGMLGHLERNTGIGITPMGERIVEGVQRIEDHFRRASFIHSLDKVAQRRMMDLSQPLLNLERRRYSIYQHYAVHPKTDDDLIQTVLDDPDMVQDAIDDLNTFAYNYAALGPYERRYVRMAIPFWGWYKFISKVAYRLPAEYPGRANILANIGMIGAEHEEATLGKRPEWLKGVIPLGEDEDGVLTYLSTMGWNPFSSIMNPFSEQGFVEGALGMGQASPPIQALLSAYGMDTMRGGMVPISPEEGVSPDYFGVPIDIENERETNPAQQAGLRRFLMGLLRSAPQVRMGEQKLAGGRPVYPESIPFFDERPMATEPKDTSMLNLLGQTLGIAPKTYDLRGYKKGIKKRVKYAKARNKTAKKRLKSELKKDKKKDK